MLNIDPKIFEKFPDALLGVATVRGAQNIAPGQEIEVQLRTLLVEEQQKLQGVEPQSLIELSSWREAYRAFGAKPSKYRSSIESLLRRAQKSADPFLINPIVDLYNLISLRYHVPCGAEDLDKISGPLRLAFATGSERGRYLGEAEESVCEAGEVAYLDDAGFVCRRWNWRESDRTKVTESTTNFIFVCEAVSKELHDPVRKALQDFSTQGAKYFGGEWALTFAEPQK